MHRLFLDANVLFSAAYKEGAVCAALWRLPDVELITSGYALEEARRNLAVPDRLERLGALAERMRIVPTPAVAEVPKGIELPEKDRPILASALASGATHLLTGDLRDFGPYFGKRVGRLRIVATRQYLKSRLEKR